MIKHRSKLRPAFSIIELLVVMSIIAIIVAIAVPAARSISRNNDENQATNVVRSMITTARSIAMSQHRMAGVVFFEETGIYSRPVNGNQTAMQIFVEDFDQRQYTTTTGGIVFVAYAAGRQYLPTGIKIATLSDTPVTFGQVLSINAVENVSTTAKTRAILFDGDGRLAMHSGLMTPDPDNTITTQGQYPKAYGNWAFLRPDGKLPGGTAVASGVVSSPAFFLYSKTEMDAQTFSGATADLDRANWLKKRSSIVVVNSNTGTVIIDKGAGE